MKRLRPSCPRARRVLRRSISNSPGRAFRISLSRRKQRPIPAGNRFQSKLLSKNEALMNDRTPQRFGALRGALALLLIAVFLANCAKSPQQTTSLTKGRFGMTERPSDCRGWVDTGVAPPAPVAGEKVQETRRAETR